MAWVAGAVREKAGTSWCLPLQKERAQRDAGWGGEVAPGFAEAPGPLQSFEHSTTTSTGKGPAYLAGVDRGARLAELEEVR